MLRYGVNTQWKLRGFIQYTDNPRYSIFRRFKGSQAPTTQQNTETYLKEYRKEAISIRSTRPIADGFDSPLD